ncbi:MAG: hypothetical protein GY789_20370 [Hyphomicrobiales bacterium]|nr:hypothetical protein [Hyphomicrobiales bacterium]MCP4999684.1 hypothetical protein [Hyphomicrobiales bacterium]
MAVALVALGRVEEASREIAAMLKKEPDYRISKARSWPYKDQTVLDLYFERLRAAGAPE